MSVNYRTTLKTTRMTSVVTDIGATGKLEIWTTGYGTKLSTINLANPAGSVTGAVLTFGGVPLSDSSAAASGTAAAARITDGTNVIVDGLTVSSSAGDIVLSSTNIVAGQPVTLTAASITHS